jgi:hypothetical protein
MWHAWEMRNACRVLAGKPEEKDDLKDKARVAGNALIHLIHNREQRQVPVNTIKTSQKGLCSMQLISRPNI